MVSEVLRFLFLQEMGIRLDQPQKPSRFWEGERETNRIFLFLLGSPKETSTPATDLCPPSFILMDSLWGSPLLAKSPQQYPSSHILGFRDAAVLAGGAGAQVSPKGGPKRTSNRITSLRMTAEIRSKSLSYCVTRDSHCGDRKCTVWGQEKELLLPSPWGSGATAVHVRGTAGAELSPSSPCHHCHRGPSRQDHEQPLLQPHSRLA